MYDSEFEKSLYKHAEALQKNLHNNQLINLWKFLNERTELSYTSFVNLSESERDQLFLSVISAESVNE